MPANTSLPAMQLFHNRTWAVGNPARANNTRAGSTNKVPWATLAEPKLRTRGIGPRATRVTSGARGNNKQPTVQSRNAAAFQVLRAFCVPNKAQSPGRVETGAPGSPARHTERRRPGTPGAIRPTAARQQQRRASRRTQRPDPVRSPRTAAAPRRGACNRASRSAERHKSGERDGPARRSPHGTAGHGSASPTARSAAAPGKGGGAPRRGPDPAPVAAPRSAQ